MGVVSIKKPAASESAFGVVIDADVYEERPDGWQFNETIAVTSDDSVDTLGTALEAAAERMMLVDETGREYAVEEEVALEEEGFPYYTPNYRSPVTVGADGSVRFYIDCKGAIEPDMASRFRSILAERVRHGTRSAHVQAVKDWEPRSPWPRRGSDQQRGPIRGKHADGPASEARLLTSWTSAGPTRVESPRNRFESPHNQASGEAHTQLISYICGDSTRICGDSTVSAAPGEDLVLVEAVAGDQVVGVGR